MIIGFLSDAHGNREGFETCLDLLKSNGAESLFFLGDAFGYFPHGMSIFHKLEELNIPCILGNHDAMATGMLPINPLGEKVYRLNNSAPPISLDAKARITATWPLSRTLFLGNRKILLIHGRPSDPLQGYLHNDSSIKPDELPAVDMIAFGHTHRPYIRRAGDILLINAGSCGLPRDIGTLPSCAMYNTDSGEATILRAHMDVEKIISSYPVDALAPEVIECLRRC